MPCGFATGVLLGSVKVGSQSCQSSMSAICTWRGSLKVFMNFGVFSASIKWQRQWARYPSGTSVAGGPIRDPFQATRMASDRAKTMQLLCRARGFLICTHVIALTDFQPVKTQDGVCGRNVEKELRQAIAQQIGLPVQLFFFWRTRA